MIKLSRNSHGQNWCKKFTFFSGYLQPTILFVRRILRRGKYTHLSGCSELSICRTST